MTGPAGVCSSPAHHIHSLPMLQGKLQLLLSCLLPARAKHGTASVHTWNEIAAVNAASVLTFPLFWH